MARPLGVHVIGAGYGESIILEMPNGGVGVIDCFAPRLGATTRDERLLANPTLRFLVHHLGADALAFLAFTHPHEDHGRGLTHLLAEFQDHIAWIWVFPSFQTIALERWFAASLDGGRRLPIERLLDEPPGSFSLELARFREQVHQQCQRDRPGRARFRSFCGYRSFLIDGEPIHVRFLGPNDDLVRQYERDLDDNLRDLVSEEVTAGVSRLVVHPEWRPDAINHNRISPALLVEYGQTRILLGGDMEQAAWEVRLADSEEPPPRWHCHLVKISHHGSPTGPPQVLYRLLRRPRGKLPLGVLTPYNRNVSPLPSAVGLRLIHPHVANVWTTNREEARLALSLQRDPGPKPDAIPDRWLVLLAANPDLWKAFAPELCAPASDGESLDAVPADLLPELEATPELVSLLHPRLRRRWLRSLLPETTAPETDCRVSFYFNDRGQELTSRRHVGANAGLIEEEDFAAP
jgi:hypothetical protein